ncbi:hypothetical protein BC834DRAFT_646040 [Gloeopeniophorella convolvens]|nr:hypothetical protein BC834DRAFT_646040 [Gloeopeniophorella convolvens]
MYDMFPKSKPLSQSRAAFYSAVAGTLTQPNATQGSRPGSPVLPRYSQHSVPGSPPPYPRELVGPSPNLATCRTRELPRISEKQAVMVSRELNIPEKDIARMKNGFRVSEELGNILLERNKLQFKFLAPPVPIGHPGRSSAQSPKESTNKGSTLGRGHASMRVLDHSQAIISTPSHSFYYSWYRLWGLILLGLYLQCIANGI